MVFLFFISSLNDGTQSLVESSIHFFSALVVHISVKAVDNINYRGWKKKCSDFSSFTIWSIFSVRTIKALFTSSCFFLQPELQTTDTVWGFTLDRSPEFSCNTGFWVNKPAAQQQFNVDNISSW